MKIILMGTSSWTVPVFERVAAEHDVVAVFTRAPKPAGRKKELKKSPVHEWAESRGLRVITNINNFDDVISNSNHEIDYILVASYGVILKDNVLNAAPCINIHPSALPKYRGPSPMATAVFNGDSESEICVMKMESEVDSGDVFMREKFLIGENDTLQDVENIVSKMSADMISEFLASPEEFPSMPQVGEPTFTRKFANADEIIDWSKTPQEIHNQIRSIGGRTKINGIECKILETKLGVSSEELGVGSEELGVRSEELGVNRACDNTRALKQEQSTPNSSLPTPNSSLPTPNSSLLTPNLEIIRIQPAGKKPMDWKSFVNGLRGAEIDIGS